MRIAITGGSGSLGRALISRLANDGADRIVAFSRDEQKRAALARDFSWHPGVRIYAGDVRDTVRMVDLFRGCEVVIHGAARKVVTAHPDEPDEMLKTNIIGSMNVIDAAQRAGVHKLVVVSSDKAVRAENVYGVSKAMMEHLAIMANARTWGSGLRIGAVRYGNVIGSTGSVVPIWREQVRQGLALTVSDISMTRFWITMPQAVDLVLGAVAGLRGGEIVIPHLPAASLGILAKAIGGEDVQTQPITNAPMERSSGARQGGEKIHEELMSHAEARRALSRNGVYVIPPFRHGEMWDDRPWLGEQVPQGFAYRSDVWPWQLTVDELRNLISQTEPLRPGANRKG